MPLLRNSVSSLCPPLHRVTQPLGKCIVPDIAERHGLIQSLCKCHLSSLGHSGLLMSPWVSVTDPLCLPCSELEIPGRTQPSLPHSKAPLRPAGLCQKPTLSLPLQACGPCPVMQEGTCCVARFLSGDIPAYPLTLGSPYGRLYWLSRVLVAQKLWVELTISQIPRQKVELKLFYSWIS